MGRLPILLMDSLGPTLEAIVANARGIIRPKILVVTSASMKVTRRFSIVLRRSKEISSGSHLPNASRTKAVAS